MVNRKLSGGRATSLAQGVLTGTLIGIVTIMTATAVMAKLIECEMISWERVGYYIIAVLLLGSIAGSWIACYRVKHRRLMVCILSGTGLWLSMLGVTALFFAGQYEGVLLTGGILYTGSLIVFMLTIPKTKHISYKKKK